MRSRDVTVKSDGTPRDAKSAELEMAQEILYVCLVCFLLRRETGDEHTSCQRFIHRWNQVAIHERFKHVAQCSDG
jgi:hypothetical protein